MGCFSLFPCFTSSKHHPKHNKSVNPTTPTHTSSSSSAHQGYHNHNNNCQTVLTKVPTQESTNIQSLHTPIPKSRDTNNIQGQVINDSDNKISVIDLHVNKHKDVSTEDVKYLSVETEAKKENGKLGAFMQIKDEIKIEKQDNKGVQVEIDDDNKIDMEVENESDKENDVKTDVPSRAISDSSVSSYISYPPMHRYGNLVTNEDADQLVIQQESSESLFSLSINPRRLSKSCPVEADDKEVNSPLKTSSPPQMTAKTVSSCTNEDADCLLNPIENLAQWKTLKTIPTIPFLDLNQEKENLYLEQEDIPIPVSEDPSFKVLDMKGKVKNNTAVTTSLSSWLVDPEKSMTESKQEESQFSTGNSYAYSDEATSWKSFEDRPILGAWTIDEVKQVSARSSPRKSPRRSPDDTPIIGTVGSYWSHTKQATDYSSSACTSPLGRSANSRRNKVNKAVSCHSSPTKRRLDRAFNKSGV